MSVPVAEFGNVNQCLSPQKNNDQYLTYVLVKIKCQVGRFGSRTDSQTIPRSHSLRSCCRVYLLRQEKEKSCVYLYRRKRRRSMFTFIVEKGEVLRLPFTPRKGVVVSCLGCSSRKEEHPKSF